MGLLDDLANKHNTDKGSNYGGPSKHGYADIYEPYLNKWRESDIRLLEVGICMESTAGGHSIRMWHEYFPNAQIYGFDIVDMRHLEREMDRVKVYQGNQSNRHQMSLMYEAFGSALFDFILEDGSHEHRDQMISFGHLFQYVKPGGYYILEDITQRGIWACCTRNDRTYDILIDLQQTGHINSEFISEEEKHYIQNNVSKIEIHKDIKDNYRTAIIQKK